MKKLEAAIMISMAAVIAISVVAYTLILNGFFASEAAAC